MALTFLLLKIGCNSSRITFMTFAIKHSNQALEISIDNLYKGKEYNLFCGKCFYYFLIVWPKQTETVESCE
jgi:hypothetical protein